jgi:hypothetical protein
MAPVGAASRTLKEESRRRSGANLQSMFFFIAITLSD